ncbi:hypothetical protein KA012_02095 [Candidatus Woesebacteria bacterium]|nr:hypothetical protein [Candidatus Woesebacteria bacterium]
MPDISPRETWFTAEHYKPLEGSIIETESTAAEKLPDSDLYKRFLEALKALEKQIQNLDIPAANIYDGSDTPLLDRVMDGGKIKGQLLLELSAFKGMTDPVQRARWQRAFLETLSRLKQSFGETYRTDSSPGQFNKPGLEPVSQSAILQFNEALRRLSPSSMTVSAIERAAIAAGIIPESNQRDGGRSRQSIAEETIDPEAFKAEMEKLAFWEPLVTVSAKSVIIINPATIPLEEPSNGMRSPTVSEVKLNPETGDLGWFISPEEPVEFVSVTPEIQTVGGQQHVVLVMVERNTDTNVETTTRIRLIQDKNARSDENPWTAAVTCEGGTTTHYRFGNPQFKVSSGVTLNRKPVIILLPEQEQEVTVDLDFDGQLTETYPESADGTWTGTASPDGTLVVDGRTYPSIFWEGIGTTAYSSAFDQGFCVAKDGVISFLEDTLTQLGVPEKYQADFITYWAPIMRANKFSLVRFLSNEYTDHAVLAVSPQPDSVLRVFMVFKSSETAVELAPQALSSTDLHGFKVIEWGGSNLDEQLTLGRTPRTL